MWTRLLQRLLSNHVLDIVYAYGAETAAVGIPTLHAVCIYGT
jgi:hypothetical protein